MFAIKSVFKSNVKITVDTQRAIGESRIAAPPAVYFPCSKY